MKIEVKDGWISFSMPINAPLRPSGTGKNLMVCSTNGPVMTEALVEGRSVTVGINAWVENPNYVKQPKQ